MLKQEKHIYYSHICSKTDLKMHIFLQLSEKAKKWQNGQTIFITGKQFQKRPNGNPDLWTSKHKQTAPGPPPPLYAQQTYWANI